MQPVREMFLSGRRRVRRLLLYRSQKPSGELHELLDLADRAGVHICRVGRQELTRAAGPVNHQGVAAEVGSYPYAEFSELAHALETSVPPAIVVLLDHVQDPQNLGSLLRTAEATAVAGVIIPADRAAGVTPAVVRASAGAAEHVRVVKVTNLVRTMGELKKAGLWLVGLEGLPEAQEYTQLDLDGPLGIVLGSEGRGLGRLVRERCDFLARIPLRGRVASLNVGVAAAIALYEAIRQRG
jgi:23S rRNA (guanosine2251-2'-O)-methyltransferase